MSQAIFHKKPTVFRGLKALCAASMLFSAAEASAATLSIMDSPAGGTLPLEVTPVGGIVIDLVGTNGTRIVSELSADSLYNGNAGTTTTIGTATGFSSSLLSALGGGISKIAIRISLWDGDSAAGDQEYGLDSLTVNGVAFGNFSAISTTGTLLTGTSAGVISTSTGFRDNYFDTGFFVLTSASSATSLATLFTSLQTSGSLLFSFVDVNPTVGWNYLDFTQGVAASMQHIGFIPGIGSPTQVLQNTGTISTPVTMNYTANGQTITVENTTIQSLTFNPGSAFAITGTLTLTSGSISSTSGGSSTISGGSLNGSTGLTFNLAGDQLVTSTIVGSGPLLKTGTATLFLTGTNTYTGATTISQGTLQVGNGSSGTINNSSSITIGTNGTLVLALGPNAVSTPNIVDNGTIQVIGANTIRLFDAISGTGSFYQNSTGTTILSGLNTFTGATVASSGTLQIGDGSTGTIAASSALSVLAGATLVLESPDSSLLNHAISDNGTVVLQMPQATGTLGNTITGSGGIVKAGTNTLIVNKAQAYTGSTVIAAGTLRTTINNALPTQALLTVNTGAIFDLGNYSQTLGSLAGGGTILTGGSTVLTVGSDNTNSIFSGLMSGSGSLIKVGSGVLDVSGPNASHALTTILGGGLQVDGSLLGGVTLQAGSLLVNGSVLGGVSIQAGSAQVNGSVQGDMAIQGGSALVNGSLLGNVSVLASGNLGGGGTIHGNVTNQGMVSSGYSSGILTIAGNYTQEATGTLFIQVGSMSSHDQLVVGGTASLLGDLLVTGKQQIRGNPYAILTATNGVEGTFTNIYTDSFLKFSVEYEANSVLLIPYYHYLTTPEMTPNQRAVATTLDKLMDTEKFYENKSLLFLGDTLSALPTQDLPAAMDRIAPTDYIILPDATFSMAQVQASNLELRMDQIRSGLVDYTAGVNTAAACAVSNSTQRGDGRRYVDTEGRELIQAPNERCLSFFLNGSGEFVSDKSATISGDGKFTTGGVSTGADYRFNDHFAAGLTAGYANTTIDGRGNGSVGIDSGDISAYATAFNEGFFLNGILGGGASNYDVKRESFGGLTHGDTNGLNFNALLGGGYTYTCGGFSGGPIASLRYCGVQIDGFSEHSSLAPLNIQEQSKSSFKSTAGFQVAYEIPVDSVIVKPQARVQWRHEYANDSRDVSASFQTGDIFTVSGPTLGTDGLLLDLGASVQLTPTVGVYAYYSGDIGASNYTSNSVFGGMQLSF